MVLVKFRLLKTSASATSIWPKSLTLPRLLLMIPLFRFEKILWTLGFEKFWGKSALNSGLREWIRQPDFAGEMDVTSIRSLERFEFVLSILQAVLNTSQLNPSHSYHRDCQFHTFNVHPMFSIHRDCRNYLRMVSQGHSSKHFFCSRIWEREAILWLPLLCGALVIIPADTNTR